MKKNKLQSAVCNLNTLIKNDGNKVILSAAKKDNVCVWWCPSSLENWNLFSLALSCPMTTCHKNEEEVIGITCKGTGNVCFLCFKAFLPGMLSPASQLPPLWSEKPKTQRMAMHCHNSPNDSQSQASIKCQPCE